MRKLAAVLLSWCRLLEAITRWLFAQKSSMLRMTVARISRPQLSPP